MKFVNFELVSAAMALSENSEPIFTDNDEIAGIEVEETSKNDFHKACNKVKKNNPTFWKNIVNDSLMYAQCKRLAFNDNEVESILNDPRRPRFIE